MARRRVLLVGGDSGVVAALREYFHVCHGDDYEVESIEYCDDALTTLLRRPFDLVLLLSLRAPWRTWPSLSLPARRIGSESAILFLKQMRVLNNPIPVLVVSGSPRADVEAAALSNGAFAFIPKPVNLAELDSLVALALAANRQAPLGE
jgi:DNA-binding NtrC family response regulator